VALQVIRGGGADHREAEDPGHALAGPEQVQEYAETEPDRAEQVVDRDLGRVLCLMRNLGHAADEIARSLGRGRLGGGCAGGEHQHRAAHPLGVDVATVLI
jgi:hypothetical protein